jgi:hypothetical protein
VKDKTKELRSELRLRTVRMEAILKEAGSGKLDSAARATFDQLAREGEVIETKLAQAKNLAGLRGKAETPTEPHAVLRSKHRYSDWLRANWSRETVSEGRSWPDQWDNAGDLGKSPVSIAEIPQLVERSASRCRG